MNGLTDNEVLKSRKQYGSNIIDKRKKNTFIKSYIETLGDPIIKILLIALAIKTILLIRHFDWFETLGILIAIFLASFISTLSEYGSEKAFERLQEENSKINVKVKRNGVINEICVDDIVVDDVVILESGDKIPADGIIISGEISIDESSITGESVEVIKNKENNNLYKGTTVTKDEAIMKVTKVGINTFYGAISLELKEKQPDSPIKVKLKKLAQGISKIGYIGAIFVFISHVFSNIVIKNNFDINLILNTMKNFEIFFPILFEGLTLAVTILVVAVPEGLPMMITLVLSSNMRRMLKENVLIRKINGIETAGSLNILFSDKTGTITEGKLHVSNFISSTLKEYSTFNSIDCNLRRIVFPSLSANNSGSYINGNVIGGNSTDKAILEFVSTEKKFNIVEKIPFNSEKKFSQIVLKIDFKNKVFTKGAPEVLLSSCNTYIDELGVVKPLNNILKLKEFVDNKSKDSSRMLAITISDKKDIDNLTLIGFIDISDKIRDEAEIAIKEVNNAGIQVVMVTGDNKNTAISIAKKVKLLKDNEICLTSDELNNLTDEQIKSLLPKLRVVARAIPSDKSRLVRICQELDLVVGMTGDGVNDAPALKRADIGFAFGSGTEVSKEASEIVILDNNFKAISKAVLYGRTAFKSIRKFIIFQLTVNICAVSLSVIGPFIGIDTPITVIQMLWVNMVMDSLAAIAFAFEPALKEYMDEPPKNRNESIINNYMLSQILTIGLYSTLLCILFLKVPFFSTVYHENRYLMTAFFGLFIFLSIFNSFNARTHRLNVVASLSKNKYFIIIISFVAIIQLLIIYFGGDLFRTYGLEFIGLELMFIFAITVIPIDFIRKIVMRKYGLKNGV